VSDNYQRDLERQNEAMREELRQWRICSGGCETPVAMVAAAQSLARELEDARDQARIATRERDAARESADDWKTCAEREKARAERAESERDRYLRQVNDAMEALVASGLQQNDLLGVEIGLLARQRDEERNAFRLAADSRDEWKARAEKAEADCAALREQVEPILRPAHLHAEGCAALDENWADECSCPLSEKTTGELCAMVQREQKTGLERLRAADAVVEAAREGCDAMVEAWPSRACTGLLSEALAFYDALVKP
jgi:hypothetical protein